MSFEIVEDAYKRLKNHIYYDSSSLHLRTEISIFENDSSSFNKKIKNLADSFTQSGASSDYWAELFDKISYSVAVKSFKEIDEVDSGIIYSSFKNKKFECNRQVYFADIPIELHIVSTIFVMLFGCKLENSLTIKPYGNKIDDYDHADKKSIKSGLKLYKPYFNEYKEWRTKAVLAVKDLDNRDKNSLLISLDIKEFYHSSRIDFIKLRKLLILDYPKNRFESQVFDIVSNTHKVYMNCFEIDQTDDKYLLPIGLPSSGVIANWYLNDMDTAITKTIQTHYYGRYVDDILLVIPFNNGETIKNKEALIKNIFCKNKILTNIDGNYKISIPGLECLEIQQSKFQIIHFTSEELTSSIDKYINESRKSSSEYRFLSDEESIDSDFDEHAFNLQYSESGRGLNNIKGFSDDKFGISNYIGKKLTLSLQGSDTDEKEGNEKLLKLFNGPMAIELYRLWEKLFTYFLVSKEMKLFHKLIRQIVHAISQLEENNIANSERYALFYASNLLMSTGMAYALKPSLLDVKAEIKRLEKLFNNYAKIDTFLSFVDSIRESNMIRHKYIQCPLINYLSKSDKKHIDLIHFDDYLSNINHSLKISNHKKNYSPRFVNFDEIMSFYVMMEIQKVSENGLFKTDVNLSADYLNDVQELYCEINNTDISDDDFDEQNTDIYELTKVQDKNEEIIVRKLSIADNEETKILRVGLANLIIPNEVISQKYLRKPFVTDKRRKELRKILNLAEEENADILVFPEISIPVSSFFWLVSYARTKQRAMVFGLEHWIIGNFALNLIVTLLPLKVNGYKSLVINIRLKNHYSPEEKDILSGYGYHIPKITTPHYDIIKWRNTALTVFNCYELCNIEHRSFFRSKIDVLFASEFNKDVNYFSSIVESTTRDLHCYVVQSNDSNFGDSRISQPTSTIDRDLIKIKGGLNPSVIIGELDIDKLRNFQIKEHNGQKREGCFKQTPPDFDRSEVLKRINDK